MPTVTDPPILDRVLDALENMAVDVETAIDVLSDPGSSESARSLAVSTMTLVPSAIRFYIEFFAGNFSINEESSDVA